MERRNSPSTCTEDALLEIENDSSICFSDSEKSWKGYETDSEAHKDYWYGKKYFECAIARKTLEESVADESLTLIDVCKYCSSSRGVLRYYMKLIQ